MTKFLIKFHIQPKRSILDFQLGTLFRKLWLSISSSELFRQRDLPREFESFPRRGLNRPCRDHRGCFSAKVGTCAPSFRSFLFFLLASPCSRFGILGRIYFATRNRRSRICEMKEAMGPRSSPLPVAAVWTISSESYWSDLIRRLPPIFMPNRSHFFRIFHNVSRFPNVMI